MSILNVLKKPEEQSEADKLRYLADTFRNQFLENHLIDISENEYDCSVSICFVDLSQRNKVIGIEAFRVYLDGNVADNKYFAESKGFILHYKTVRSFLDTKYSNFHYKYMDYLDKRFKAALKKDLDANQDSTDSNEIDPEGPDNIERKIA